MRLADSTQKLVAGVVVVAIVTAAVLLPGPRSGVAGLSLDTLFWSREAAYGPRRAAVQSQVALVLIDEATYAAEPFHGLSKEFWLPFFADVLRGIGQGEPRAIGFDIILPTSVERFVPGYERGFMEALSELGGADKLVMAKFRGQGETIAPPRPQILALGGAGNVRSVNMVEDADGIVRRAPLAFRTARGTLEPSFSGELARRAGADPPDGEELLLNWDGGRPFYAYSFADIHACARAGNADFFRSAFAGKIVIVATGLDVEDRLLTSRRLINPPEEMNGPRCNGAAPGVTPLHAFSRPSLPGAFVHAAAIDNLLRHEALRPMPLWAQAAWVAAFAAMAAILAIGVPLIWGALGLGVVGLLLALFATAMMQLAIPTPLVESVAAAMLSYGLMVAFRYTFSDRDKRRIRRIFSLYLAPSVIERLVQTGQMPALGGERREMTFFFSDIAGFTTMSEGADPATLAPLLNAYFDGVCEVILKYGGLVVDFAGDGLHALFGAPADQPDHAARGIAAAREAAAFVETFRAGYAERGVHFGHTRIGLHTGPALVGNLGATRRLKYTALGDAVNTAARLEGLNKYFGTRSCVSEATRAAANESDVRPIGDIVLKGRSEALRVHELLHQGDAQDPRVRAYVAAFEALEQDAPDAAQRLRQVADENPDDGCARYHLARIAGGERGARIVMTDK